MKTVSLSNSSKVILVDDEDYLRVSQISWSMGCRGIQGGNGDTHRLGRFLLRYCGPLQVDHIDGNLLNNQKSNLQVINGSLNCYKKTLTKNTSGYRGVKWDKKSKAWQACITKDQIRHYLGLFSNKENAALAYNKKAQQLYGENAYQNELIKDKYKELEVELA